VIDLAAAGAVAGDHSVARLFIALAAIFAGTKILGELSLRLKQPTVLGEIIAGVLLGGSVLGIVDPVDPVIHAMSEIGVVVLLFATGLNTELSTLVRVGGAATAVAVVGVVLPMASGYYAAEALGATPIQALVAGAAMCATSVGISARVMGDLGQLDTREGQVVLGAAVIDDIIGLIVLAVVMAIAAGGGMGIGATARIGAIAVGFVVVAVLIGGRIASVGHHLVKRAQSAGTLGLLALAFAFALAALADSVGSALIIGAFAAGLVLDDRHDRAEIERATTAVGHFFVPIFFASVGAQVNLGAMANAKSLGIGAALIVCGVAGKMLAGWAPVWFRGNKRLIGMAMVPRGEVGLIFAQMGIASGAIDDGLFGAIMLMVLVTTLVTPPMLASEARRSARRGQRRANELEGNIDDLIVGVAVDEDQGDTGGQHRD
jgi:Kef-type K+ transport system membrane component KefB